MHLKRLELQGFKSFAEKSEFIFDVPIIAIVGPNGSGKSNVVEAIRFVLGEQSVKSMRGKTGSDLIFKGSSDISKKSRASVTIVFDNKDRVFKLEHNDNTVLGVDFDEISITRQVFADGTNTYLINGNEVRMKDIHNLIASVNIGSSGHHIISQGEADRYLNAGIKERRVLIEEALGLKVYQYRIKESERKLEKALENLRESEIVRRELAPQLRFLKRQVDQIERAQNLRIELQEKYTQYISYEDALIARRAFEHESEHSFITKELSRIHEFLDQHKPQDQHHTRYDQKIQELQIKVNEIRNSISNIQREQGRIEGMVDILSQQGQSKKGKESLSQVISFDEFSRVSQDIIERLQSISYENIESIRASVSQVIQTLTSFLTQRSQDVSITASKPEGEIDKLTRLSEQQRALESKLKEQESIFMNLESELVDYRAEREKELDIQREKDKQYYEYLAQKKELDGRQALWESEDNALNTRIQRRHEELEEAKTLLGISELAYSQIALEDIPDDIEYSQEQRRRDIERIKIRIEDIGGGSGVDVLREYEEIKERDMFLEKEIYDISHSVESLQGIIDKLKESLRVEFEEGIKKINKEFNRFFGLMFGGGKASLETVYITKRKSSLMDKESKELEIDEDSLAHEYGIDIYVELPRKKVSDLNMLSGGERSLTSIALLFALSQVNPPPFLVLDETDAALDEANSKKYGDMIESLSEYSQLIIVTHNRETMSRAQTLFGVTLGRNDSSTVLSLRLQDATQYAK